MKSVVPGESPCYYINVRRAANLLTRFYDKTLEPINLSVSQFSLLNKIKQMGPCNKSALAQYSGLDRTTIIRNLNTLRDSALITEVPGTDKRNALVQLTDLGESALTAGLPLWKQAQDQVKAVVGSECIEHLKNILAKIETL